MRKILVVAAHPDDEVLGCGGTIIRHAESGDQVHILIMAEGLTSRSDVRNTEAYAAELKELHGNSQKAASVELLNFSDNRMLIFNTV